MDEQKPRTQKKNFEVRFKTSREVYEKVVKLSQDSKNSKLKRTAFFEKIFLIGFNSFLDEDKIQQEIGEIVGLKQNTIADKIKEIQQFLKELSII